MPHFLSLIWIFSSRKSHKKLQFSRRYGKRDNKYQVKCIQFRSATFPIFMYYFHFEIKVSISNMMFHIAYPKFFLNFIEKRPIIVQVQKNNTSSLKLDKSGIEDCYLYILSAFHKYAFVYVWQSPDHVFICIWWMVCTFTTYDKS